MTDEKMWLVKGKFKNHIFWDFKEKELNADLEEQFLSKELVLRKIDDLKKITEDKVETESKNCKECENTSEGAYCKYHRMRWLEVANKISILNNLKQVLNDCKADFKEILK